MIELPPITRLGLLLVRPGMLVAAAPGLGLGFAPAPAKIAVTTLIALAMVPVVELPAELPPGGIAVVVLREAAIGLALAMSVRVLVAGAEFGGHLAGFQLGFSYASLVDPQTGARNNVMSALYGSLALFVFLAANGHHVLLRAFAASYASLPVGGGGLDGSLAVVVSHMLGIVFSLGAQLAAPVVIVLLIVELALGLLSRTAPSLNLMMLGFPVRLAFGLLALAAVLHVVPPVVRGAVPSALEAAARAAQAFR